MDRKLKKKSLWRVSQTFFVIFNSIQHTHMCVCIYIDNIQKQCQLLLAIMRWNDTKQKSVLYSNDSTLSVQSSTAGSSDGIELCKWNLYCVSQTTFCLHYNNVASWWKSVATKLPTVQTLNFKCGDLMKHKTQQQKPQNESLKSQR